jgi:hypothetical protein
VYLDIFEEFLIPILEEKGSTYMLFQQDRAHPSFNKEMTNFLNSKFSGKWIGRAGSITCSHHSPDFTPLDFYFVEKTVQWRNKIFRDFACFTNPE